MAVTSVNDAATSQTLLAPADAMSLHGASIWNASTEILYVLQGNGTASIAAGGYSFQLAPGDYWESPHPMYARGGLTGIWANNSSGYAQVTTW